MDNYFNLERVKQAHGLIDSIREYNRNRTDPKKQPKLDSIELTVLMVLARKMGRKTDLTTGEIENGCRAALVTLEHETLLERTAIGRALSRLIDAGFITKTYDRCRLIELTKEGQRRKAIGLSLDCPEKNNYERRPLGRPRNDKSDLGQWKHCVYHLVPAVWDGVVFDSKEVRVALVTPVSAEDQAILDSIDPPVATKESTGTGVTKNQADEVFEDIKHYFAAHSTLANQSEKDARRSMNEACVDLAQRALDLGDIKYAGDFLWWLIQRRSEIVEKLMDGTIKNLGVSFGLPKYISEFWDEFVPEKDDEIADPNAPEDYSTNDESEYVSSTLADDEGGDDGFTTTPVAKVATPVLGFEDEDEPVEEIEPEPPVDPAVLAEIEAERVAAEAERVAAEEQAREAERKRKAEAEAAEAQRVRNKEIAEAQRKQKQREANCRYVLVKNTDKELGTFDYKGKPKDVCIVRDYLTTNYPDTFAIASETESTLVGMVSGSLLDAINNDPIGFEKIGCLELVVAA